jgi:prophage antirepressor-like protein
MEYFLKISKSSDYAVFPLEGAKQNRARVVGTFEEPWFCGKDVCAILEYKRPNNVLWKRLDREDKKTLKELSEELSEEAVEGANTSILGRNNLLNLSHNEGNNLSHNGGKAIYISEPGLYRLVFGSRAPMARAFQDFVCEVVLPSIRKHGHFILVQGETQLLQQQEQLTIELEQKFGIDNPRLERAKRMHRELLESLDPPPVYENEKTEELARIARKRVGVVYYNKKLQELLDDVDQS